jgi:TPR repeat protein
MPVVPGIVLILMVLLPLTVSAGSFEVRPAYRSGDYAAVLRESGSGAQGGPVDRFFLALMYLRGEGVPRNETRGLELLRSSAEAGYSAAQYLLGQRYFYGNGVPADKTRALSNLRAASVDDYRAVVLLKIIAQGSRGEKKDLESVATTVKRKAVSRDSNAQLTLAFMHLIGDGVPKDGREEVRWYRAAAGKNTRAAFILSLMYQSGEGVSRNPAEAFRLMRSAADKGDPRAQYYLGTFYYQGIGTQADQQSAADWFRKSAVNGYADAQLAYGMLLLSGDGVAVDKAQAVEWLSRAARQNNEGAREVLRELLTYRGLPVVSPMSDATQSFYQTEKQQSDKQLRLEGKGVLLDKGDFGLKFSLPTLYDAYAPLNQTTARPLWEKFQGGTFELIIRQSR